MKRILLVSDHPEECTLFKKALSLISHELTIIHVDSSEKLFHLIRYFTPDILFLDINVQDANVVDCLQKLRADAGYDSLPIFIYSNLENAEYIDECYLSKANYYIIKHNCCEDIRKTLQKALAINWNTERFPSKETFVIS